MHEACARSSSRLRGRAGRAAGPGAGTLGAPLQYGLEGTGKRLRGVLCVLAYRALGGGFGQIITAGGDPRIFQFGVKYGF